MTKKIFQKYFTDSFFLNVPLVINMVITLITLPIILASLPIADYGKWQFILALQSWLVAFSGSNITSASKRGIARGLKGTFLYAFLARLKLLILIGLVIIFTAGVLKFLGYFTFSILLVILGLYLIFGYLFQISFYEFLIAKKEFRKWCFWQVLISFVSQVGSAIIAYLTKNVIYFALFQLGSTAILSWVGWFWITKKEKLTESYKKGEIDKECVLYGLKLIPVDLVSITSTKLSHFIIGPFFGFSNLAIFSVANKLRDKCAGVIKSIRPMLYADFAKKEGKELIKIINRHLVKIGILSSVLSLIFLLTGWFYIILFLPKTFHQATIYLAILLLGLPSGMIAILLHTALESHLRYKELAIVGVVSNLLKVFLILLFGYLWKIIGICFALAVSGWISFGFYYFLTLKKQSAIKFMVIA